jgi:cell division protein FtsB
MEEMKARIHELEVDKKELESQLANLQKDNEFLIKNAADELQKITDFIELY